MQEGGFCIVAQRALDATINIYDCVIAGLTLTDDALVSNNSANCVADDGVRFNLYRAGLRDRFSNLLFIVSDARLNLLKSERVARFLAVIFEKERERHDLA